MDCFQLRNFHRMEIWVRKWRDIYNPNIIKEVTIKIIVHYKNGYSVPYSEDVCRNFFNSASAKERLWFDRMDAILNYEKNRNHNKNNPCLLFPEIKAESGNFKVILDENFDAIKDNDIFYKCSIYTGEPPITGKFNINTNNFYLRNYQDAYKVILEDKFTITFKSPEKIQGIVLAEARKLINFCNKSTLLLSEIKGVKVNYTFDTNFYPNQNKETITLEFYSN